MENNRWGQARIEVTALRALILARLEEGYTVRRVWFELRNQGKVTVALRNFYREVRKIQAEAGPLGLTPVPALLAGTIKTPLKASSQSAPNFSKSKFDHPAETPHLVLTLAEDANERPATTDHGSAEGPVGKTNTRERDDNASGSDLAG